MKRERPSHVRNAQPCCPRRLRWRYREEDWCVASSISKTVCPTLFLSLLSALCRCASSVPLCISKLQVMLLMNAARASAAAAPTAAQHLPRPSPSMSLWFSSLLLDGQATRCRGHSIEVAANTQAG